MAKKQTWTTNENRSANGSGRVEGRYGSAEEIRVGYIVGCGSVWSALKRIWTQLEASQVGLMSGQIQSTRRMTEVGSDRRRRCTHNKLGGRGRQHHHRGRHERRRIKRLAKWGLLVEIEVKEIVVVEGEKLLSKADKGWIWLTRSGMAWRGWDLHGETSVSRGMIVDGLWSRRDGE